MSGRQPVPDGAMRMFRARWGGASDAEAIENVADELTDGAEVRLPVDPTAIANRFGARVINLPRDASGALAPSRHGELSVVNERWQVLVPADILNERRRFSIAHEIGHILLFDAVAEQPELVRELRKRIFHAYVEKVCNQIAARILMPTQAFNSAIIRRGGLGATAVLDRLADDFWVSSGAAIRRIVELEPTRRLLIWDYVLDHPRGPAWRTSKEQDRSRGPFVPDGLSASRLRPNVVHAAAEAGSSSSEVVMFDSPNLRELHHVYAYRRRERGMNRLGLDEFDARSSPFIPRVYLIGEASSAR